MFGGVPTRGITLLSGLYLGPPIHGNHQCGFSSAESTWLELGVGFIRVGGKFQV